jgi:hypothetical protein
VVKLKEVAKANGWISSQLSILGAGQGRRPGPDSGHRGAVDLEENAAAANVTDCGADSIFPPDAAAVERYTPSMMALLNG